MAKRTLTQNASLHVAFKLISDSLNEAGLTVDAVMTKGIELDWNEHLVKEILWRMVQKYKFGTTSTTQLEKLGEIEEVYDTIMRTLGERHGIEYIPFPHDPNKISNYATVK